MLFPLSLYGAYAFVEIALSTLGPWGDTQVPQVSKCKCHLKMLEETKRKCYRRSVKGSSGVWCLHSAPQKDGEVGKAEKEHREGTRAPGSAHHYILTAGSGGVFPRHPKEDILCSHVLLEGNLIPAKEKPLPGNTGAGGWRRLWFSEDSKSSSHCLSSFAVSLQGSNPSALGFCSEPWLGQLEDRWKSLIPSPKALTVLPLLP